MLYCFRPLALGGAIVLELTPLEIMLIASTLLEFNPLIQAIKIAKLKRAKEVALPTYLMILTIGTMWLIYGIQIQSLPLIVGNAIKCATTGTVVFLYLKYKNK